jgi:NAD(P)-dependent dehydrogenase (short-subunit alcohol dehydrogenase family)
MIFSRPTFLIVIITGASTRSVGQQTALALARGSPNHLILLSRTESKVLPVIEQITAMDSSISVRFIKMDLGSQASVRAAAAEILKTVPHIDALINNAGVMAVPYELTPEGIEMQFGINHIGHFLLTNLLIPRMRPGSRIVNVSSAGHSMSGVRFDDVNFATGADYDMWDAYGQSKSANILFAIALAGRLAKKGIQAFSLHPGFTAGESELATHLVDPDWAEILKKFNGRDDSATYTC